MCDVPGVGLTVVTFHRFHLSRMKGIQLMFKFTHQNNFSVLPEVDVQLREGE